MIDNGYERQFIYVYGAVSPLEGQLDWRLCREMNTVRMGEFLAQVSQAQPTDLIVMVLDGASSHKAKDRVIPENIRLLALPPYAPELNPQEHVWDELREKEFPPPGVQPLGCGHPAVGSWLAPFGCPCGRTSKPNRLALDC